MSAELLQQVRAHVGHLIEGYQVRYFQWTDYDLVGSGQVILFRMAGTSGPSDHQIQYPDVSIQLVCDSDKVLEGDAVMLEIVRFLRSDLGFTSEYVEGYEPMKVTGPSRLENGRMRFELVLRCLVENH